MSSKTILSLVKLSPCVLLLLIYYFSIISISNSGKMYIMLKWQEICLGQKRFIFAGTNPRMVSPSKTVMNSTTGPVRCYGAMELTRSVVTTFFAGALTETLSPAVGVFSFAGYARKINTFIIFFSFCCLPSQSFITLQIWAFASADGMTVTSPFWTQQPMIERNRSVVPVMMNMKMWATCRFWLR